MKENSLEEPCAAMVDEVTEPRPLLHPLTLDPECGGWLARGGYPLSWDPDLEPESDLDPLLLNSLWAICICSQRDFSLLIESVFFYPLVMKVSGGEVNESLKFDGKMECKISQA